MSAGHSTAPVTAADAVAYFTTRSHFETDVADVHADLHAGVDDLVVVDARSEESWNQGHIPGAVHLSGGQIIARAADLIRPDLTVVTYCWGPACNGAARAALAFARLGYRVKEMLGGYEYWVREGFAVQTANGQITRPADPLTAPPSGLTCGC